MLNDESDELKKFSLEKAPKRPPKIGHVESDGVLIQADNLMPGTNSTTCMVCGKTLDHLNEIRRSAHINNCLDLQESKDNHSKEKVKWESTYDCPMCNEPLGPGPYRATHAKQCAKKHNLSATELHKLMETQVKIAKEKKKIGVNHTNAKEPVLQIKRPKDKEMPKSRFDEQLKLGLALSSSITPPDWRLNPLMKNAKRNQFFLKPHAPLECRCNVVDAMQRRFVQTFKVKQLRKDSEANEIGNFEEDNLLRRNLTSEFVIKAFKKLDRFERFADDFRKYCTRNSGDINIECKDGYVSAHSFILSVRTTLQPTPGSKTIYLDNFDTTTIDAYIKYVESSSVEWGRAQVFDLIELANTYGPKDLLTVLDDMKPVLEENDLQIFDEFVEPFYEADGELNENRREVVEELDIRKSGHQIHEQKDCYFNANLDQIISEPLEEENRREVVKTPIKRLDFGNDESDSESVIVIEDSLLHEKSIVPESILEFEDHNPRRSLFKKSNSSIDISQQFVEESPKSPPSKRSKTSFSQVMATPKMNLDEALNFLASPIDDEITKRVKEMSEKFRRRKSYSQSGPSNSENLSFMFSPGVIEPVEMYANRMSDSFNKDNSMFIQALNEDPLPFKPVPMHEEPLKPGKNLFFDDIQTSLNAPLNRFPKPRIATAVKIKQKLGSAVKILKTADITPIPDFQGMNKEEIKNELDKYGLRPMGKKKAIETLTKIYNTTHPVVDVETPTTSRAYEAISLRRLSEEKLDLENDLLNQSLQENIEESCLFSDKDDSQENSPTKLQKLPKDLDKLQELFVEWIRLPINYELYHRVLVLQPVSLEELTGILAKTEHPIRKIPKKSLIDILDRLHITFTLPQDGWHRRRQRKQNNNKNKIIL